VVEVDQQAEAKSGSLQVIETLGGVLGGELIDALEFEDQQIFDDDIGEVVAHGFTLVGTVRAVSLSALSPRKRNSATRAR
jgi:hypothetical protein